MVFEGVCSMRNKVTFERLHKLRKNFLKENETKDHVVISGDSKILISVPHFVSQVRLGKYKVPEIGSLATGMFLQQETKSFLLAKTKNNFDDANFDEVCDYRKTLCDLIEKNNIKYILDIHGLAANRNCDINVGTHLGTNISNNINAFDDLIKSLESRGLTVVIDQPFMAGHDTISSYTKRTFKDCWSIQLEINCSISNKKENFTKYMIVLETLKEWMLKI